MEQILITNYVIFQYQKITHEFSVKKAISNLKNIVVKGKEIQKKYSIINCKMVETVKYLDGIYIVTCKKNNKIIILTCLGEKDNLLCFKNKNIPQILAQRQLII